MVLGQKTFFSLSQYFKNGGEPKMYDQMKKKYEEQQERVKRAKQSIIAGTERIVIKK